MIRLVKVEGYTNQRVDRRSVDDRTRAEEPVERSLLGVHLPSGFGTQPG